MFVWQDSEYASGSLYFPAILWILNIRERKSN